MSHLYIGLMSGTSVDGIDAALVDFSQARPMIVATHYTPFSPSMRQQILALCQQGDNEIQRLGELDICLGKAFAQAANTLLETESLAASAIKAIGSHGQTIRHQPNRFTLQIGDPNTIAAETGITTVADFRRRDVAIGGQGAPLVPAFHQSVFASNQRHRAIVNIGGIANVTFLPKKATGAIIGFDTGPGNVLMDAWIHTHQQLSHDKNGAWGAQGKVDVGLLTRLLSDTYFQLPAPKSTGREYFNLAWLEQHLLAMTKEISPADVQATLTELTALSIMETVCAYMPDGDILICGGGAHNGLLMGRLHAWSSPENRDFMHAVAKTRNMGPRFRGDDIGGYTVASTKEFGIDPDWVEAMAFAWLAKQTLHHQTGNLPSVTGATHATILGGVYYGEHAPVNS